MTRTAEKIQGSSSESSILVHGKGGAQGKQVYPPPFGRLGRQAPGLRQQNQQEVVVVSGKCLCTLKLR